MVKKKKKKLYQNYNVSQKKYFCCKIEYQKDKYKIFFLSYFFTIQSSLLSLHLTLKNCTRTVYSTSLFLKYKQ